MFHNFCHDFRAGSFHDRLRCAQKGRSAAASNARAKRLADF